MRESEKRRDQLDLARRDKLEVRTFIHRWSKKRLDSRNWKKIWRKKEHLKQVQVASSKRTDLFCDPKIGPEI